MNGVMAITLRYYAGLFMF